MFLDKCKDQIDQLQEFFARAVQILAIEDRGITERFCGERWEVIP